VGGASRNMINTRQLVGFCYFPTPTAALVTRFMPHKESLRISDFRAQHNDPYLNRFQQPDTVIPGAATHRRGDLSNAPPSASRDNKF
jgi:hypothetical protein